MPKPEGPQFTQYGQGMAVAPPPTEYVDEPRMAAGNEPPKNPPNENAETPKKNTKKMSKKGTTSKYKDN